MTCTVLHKNVTNTYIVWEGAVTVTVAGRDCPVINDTMVTTCQRPKRPRKGFDTLRLGDSGRKNSICTYFIFQNNLANILQVLIASGIRASGVRGICTAGTSGFCKYAAKVFRIHCYSYFGDMYFYEWCYYYR